MSNPYKTRSITITDKTRSVAVAMVVHAPEGIEIVAREPVKARGLDANGYYWLRLGEIAEQAWVDGKQFDADTWHYYCGRKVMNNTITTKDGIERSKWIETPDGAVKVISTTQLEKGCFAEYTTMVEAFGAGLGVMFSANPRHNATFNTIKMLPLNQNVLTVEATCKYIM